MDQSRKERISTDLHAEADQGSQDKLVGMLGSECAACGSTDDLQFDHVDRNTKSFGPNNGNLNKNWKVLLIEVAKCQLLCNPCHIEESRHEMPGPPLTWQHGTTTGYRAYKCRCEPCVKAQSDYAKA